MDQNSHEDGLCSWQSRGLTHPRALRANSLPLQLVPVRSESLGKLCWNHLLSSRSSQSGRVLLISGMFVKLHFVLGVMQVTGCHGQQFRKSRANFSLEMKFLALVLQVTSGSCFEQCLLGFSLCSSQKPHDEFCKAKYCHIHGTSIFATSAGGLCHMPGDWGTVPSHGSVVACSLRGTSCRKLPGCCSDDYSMTWDFFQA